MLTVGSCFAGIGGIELGLERTGQFQTVWQIEKDPYALAILAKHWPDVVRYEDIKSIDPESLAKVDVVCGGYPCQPFSLAGRRGGENDERHLWPFMLRIIRHLRPKFALLENVPGHLSMGFGRVLGDLSECGYDADWGVLSAAGVGAPHLRRRVFILAHSEHAEWRASDSKGRNLERKGSLQKRKEDSGGIGIGCAPVAFTTEMADAAVIVQRKQTDETNAVAAGRETWKESRCRGWGTDPWWATEPNVGRVASRIPSRVDRLRCLGNAVVPQVAEKVGRMILETA